MRLVHCKRAWAVLELLAGSPEFGYTSETMRVNHLPLLKMAVWALLIISLVGCQAASPPPLEPSLPVPQAATIAFTATPSPVPTPMPTPTATVAPELQVALADLKGMKIQLWHPLNGAAAAELDRQARLFNQFNSWGIQVSLVGPGGDGPLMDAVEQAKPEELPDVVLAASEQIAAWKQDRDLAQDLTVYLTDPQFGFPAGEQAGFRADFWQQDSFGSAQIGIPALRTVSGLIYNRSYAAELKFTAPPATPKELLEQTCAAAKANNQFLERMGTGGWMVDTGSMTALSWLTAFGASVEPASPGGAWKFDQAGSVDALRYLRAMQEKGCLWVPRNPTPAVYFSARHALLYTATLQDIPLQRGYHAKINAKDEWAFIPFPSVDGKGVLYAYGYSYAVLRGDPKAQLAAWLFVRWMSQPDVQAYLAESWVSLPVSAGMATKIAAQTTTANRSLWEMVLALDPGARPAPTAASWAVVRRPLQDAFWQLFNIASADQIPQILPALDQMAAELLKPTQ